MSQHLQADVTIKVRAVELVDTFTPGAPESYTYPELDEIVRRGVTDALREFFGSHVGNDVQVDVEVQHGTVERAEAA